MCSNGYMIRAFHIMFTCWMPSGQHFEIELCVPYHSTQFAVGWSLFEKGGREKSLH